MRFALLIFIACLLALLQGCTSGYQGHYKVGKQYTVRKVKYTPKEVDIYDKVGLASWYGPGFHGQDTANGETFDKHDLTAAHATLPLPSIVKVTNLENKQSLVVRVNDRGPFRSKFTKRHHKPRLIDLSERAAELLGIKEKGLCKVRVKLLPIATDELHTKLNLKKKNVAESSAIHVKR